MAGSHEVRGSIPLGSTKFSRFGICRTFFISSRFDSPHICNRTPSFGFNIEPKAKPAPPKNYAEKISK